MTVSIEKAILADICLGIPLGKLIFSVSAHEGLDEITGSAPDTFLLRGEQLALMKSLYEKGDRGAVPGLCDGGGAAAFRQRCAEARVGREDPRLVFGAADVAAGFRAWPQGEAGQEQYRLLVRPPMHGLCAVLRQDRSLRTHHPRRCGAPAECADGRRRDSAQRGQAGTVGSRQSDGPDLQAALSG